MARTIPLFSSKQLDPSPLSLLFFSAFLLLTIITLISTLCASHHRKSRPPSPPPTQTSSFEVHEQKIPVLPATHGPIGPTEPPASSAMTPRRKLSLSMSLKLPEGLTRVRTGRREDSEKERMASEDSTWMKAIILGEKCKVPDNGEQEEDEEIVVYDEKGNRRRNYHPRTPRSTPAASRTNSFAFLSSFS